MKPAEAITVVGIVADTRDNGLNRPARPTMYIPYRQQNHLKFRMSFLSLAIRADRDAKKLTSGIRAALAALDPDLPLSQVDTMQDLIEGSTTEWRQSMLMFGGFGALALVLASLGIYAVMAYTVAQRTSEIGVRMALGARPADILRMVARQSLLLWIVGVVIGTGLALLATKPLAMFLVPELSPADPATFLAAIVVLGAVAALATLGPALRALRVDPVTALRWE